MKCAAEIRTIITEKEERIEKEILERYWKEFKQDLPKIEKLIETTLVNRGQFATFIEKSWASGFYQFVNKSFKYLKDKPYWSYEGTGLHIPLDFFCEYLRGLCYEVEIIKKPFTAYSSTGKSSTTMEGLTLKISVPKELPCM